MIVKILGSSSKGNCYLFETANTCLVVEAGISISEVKKALNYNMSKILGCIITHEHKDHSKYIKEYLNCGIKCYTSKGTIDALEINNPFLCEITPLVDFRLDSWRILPFNTKHDCRQPLGYLINHKKCGTVLFATDTYYLPNTFKNLNNIFIECNYSTEILKNSNIDDSLKKRIISSHLSLETCINTLKANDLSKVENIVLIHLSDNNSDEKLFKQKVQEATGKIVYIANRNVEIKLGGF